MNLGGATGSRAIADTAETPRGRIGDAIDALAATRGMNEELGKKLA